MSPSPAMPVVAGQIVGCDHVNPYPEATWIRTPPSGVGAGSSYGPSCNTICADAGRTCVRAGIQAVTLDSSNPSCQFQLCAIPTYTSCQQCGPSTSPNRYCFPGVSGGSSF